MFQMYWIQGFLVPHIDNLSSRKGEVKMVTIAEKMLSDYVPALNSHDLEKLLSFYTDDCVCEDLGAGVINRGKKELKTFYKTWFDVYPDSKFELTSVFSTNDWLAAEYITSGTHTKDGFGLPATGKHFSIRTASIAELRDGKINRSSDYYNMVTFLQQVGLLPDTVPNRFGRFMLRIMMKRGK
jgi:steroid delta-isomerase-like uncharacterized protein